MPGTDPEHIKRAIGLDPERPSVKRRVGQSWFLGLGINHYLHFSNLNNAVKDVKDLILLLQGQNDFGQDRGHLFGQYRV